MLTSAWESGVRFLSGGSDGTRQVREPSDEFTVVDRDPTAIADIRAPQSSAITPRPYHSRLLSDPHDRRLRNRSTMHHSA